MLSGQAASLIASATKKGAELQDFRDAADALIKCIESANEAAVKLQNDPKADPEGKFEATKLGSPEFLAWLVQLGKKLLDSISKKAEQQNGEMVKLVSKAEHLLSKLPVFSLAHEDEYRKIMGTLHSTFASHGAHIRKCGKEMQEVSCSFKKLQSASGLDPSNDAAGQWAVAGKKAQGHGQCLVTHLTVYAMITLLRSPVIGSKSDSGKKLAKNLQDLIRTFLEKDFIATPVHAQLPLDSALKLCKSCEEAACASGLAYWHIGMLDSGLLAIGCCPRLWS